MKKFIFILLAGIAPPASAVPLNLTAYLEEYPLRLGESAFNDRRPKEGQAISIASRIVETFDQWGNGRRLYISSHSNIIYRYGINIMARTLGVEFLPAYPVLVDLKTIFPEQKIDESGNVFAVENGRSPSPYVSGLMIASPTEELDHPDEISTPELVDYMRALTFSYLCFFTTPRISFKSGRAVASPGSWLVEQQRTPRETEKYFQSYMSDSLPWKALAQATDLDIAYIKFHLEHFFARAEQFADLHFDKIFAPAFYAMREESMITVQNTTGYQAMFKSRILNARQLMEDYLSKRVGGKLKGLKLEISDTLRKIARDEILVSHPKFNFHANLNVLPDISDPAPRRKNEKELLFSYFLASLEQKRHINKLWQDQLGTSEHPVSLLLKESAAFDSTMKLVGINKLNGADDDELSTPPQLFLNHSLPKTLVVFAEDDREALHIGEITRKLASSLNLIALPVHRGSQRPQLESSDIDPILVAAQTCQCKRVVINELGGVPPQEKQKFAERGLELVHFDHHDNDLSSWQWRSNAEQLWHFYGYQPDFDELAIAIHDRSGLTGLFDAFQTSPAGLRPYYTQNFLHGRQISYDLSDIADFASDKIDDVLFFSDDRHDMKTMARALAIRNFPANPEFVLERQSKLIVMARPELVFRIRKDLGKRFTIALGGDLNQSLFLVIRDIKYEDRQKVVAQIKAMLRNGRSGTQQPCGNTFRSSALPYTPLKT